MLENKWYQDYTDGIDINKIYYINVNDEELHKFYDDNDYVVDKGDFIASDDGNYSWIAPAGMHYLQFNRLPGMKYVLGIVDNNINKKTIVSALAYMDDYKLFSDQEKFITYLSTVETNLYFRGNGLFKNLVVNSYKFINPKQNILISGESKMGKICNVRNHIIGTYRKLGFNMDIRSDTDGFNIDEYYDYLKNTGCVKVKKK